AVQAIDEGRFDREIVPVEVPGRKGPVTVATDEAPRRDTSLESLGKLRPAFPSDAPKGLDELVVTAGNSPGLNDGASALVVTSEEFARSEGLRIRARIDSYAAGGTEPRDLFFAPVIAVRRLMERE